MSGHRRSVRLRGYAYAGGLYFVTVCTAGRAPLFGAVVGGEVRLSAAGRLARDESGRTFRQRPTLVPDVFVVMPDHVHLLFGIGLADGGVGSGGGGVAERGEGTARRAPTVPGASLPGGGAGRRFAAPETGTVATVVRAYKSAVTRAVNLARGTPGALVWQRGYHDRVVRTDREAEHVRRYILGNPARTSVHRPHHRP
ncbi:transposase [Rubrivirga sp.]|uniref:transposase n=1 Tax=Rubrivirga sp. TaxID=1885344 RepID=UPI003B52DC74